MTADDRPSPSFRPFGVMPDGIGRLDRRRREAGTIVVTSPEDIAKLRPTMTDELREFIRRSDLATAGGRHEEGYPDRRFGSLPRGR